MLTSCSAHDEGSITLTSRSDALKSVCVLSTSFATRAIMSDCMVLATIGRTAASWLRASCNWWCMLPLRWLCGGLLLLLCNWSAWPEDVSKRLVLLARASFCSSPMIMLHSAHACHYQGVTYFFFEASKVPGRGGSLVLEQRERNKKQETRRKKTFNRTCLSFSRSMAAICSHSALITLTDWLISGAVLICLTSSSGLAVHVKPPHTLARTAN